MPDDADRANAEIEHNMDVVMARQKQNRPRFTPYMLDGEPCCPDCLDPLPEHRKEAGICVECLTAREHKGRVNGY